LPLVVAVISAARSRVLLLDVGKVSEVIEDFVLSIPVTLRPCVVAVLPIVILIIEGAPFQNLKIARAENGIVNDGSLLEAWGLRKALILGSWLLLVAGRVASRLIVELFGWSRTSWKLYAATAFCLGDDCSSGAPVELDSGSDFAGKTIQRSCRMGEHLR
jgi:hypothetical protein